MLSAPFHINKCLYPAIKRNWGRIINISSVYRFPQQSSIHLRLGIVGLTKVTSLELATYGITCNAMCHRYMNTHILQKQVVTLQEEMNSSYQEANHVFLSKYHATLQCIEVKHLAATAGFLCSDSTQQITGSYLIIDGEWTAK